jgi:hypothetical protein
VKYETVQHEDHFSAERFLPNWERD